MASSLAAWQLLVILLLGVGAQLQVEMAEVVLLLLCCLNSIAMASLRSVALGLLAEAQPPSLSFPEKKER